MKLTDETRRKIKERDKVCVYCADGLGPFEVDHIRSRRYGGSDALANLALACQRCNQLKGAQTVDAFLAKMKLVREGKMEIVANLRGSYKRYTFKRLRTFK